jgi:hypothetical protein
MIVSAPLDEPQSAAAVLMVRPACFGFNPQTAPSNAFQVLPAEALPAEAASSERRNLAELALREFDALAERLMRAGVEVIAVEDTVEPAKPDAIFPNNWVSFHRDGTVVLYPMLAPNRRLERREDVVRQVIRAGSFRASRTLDLSGHEERQQYLEGTGSLVLDRTNRVAYANLSPRTDLDVLGDFAQQLDYDLVSFEAVDGNGRPIYHTNVMMAIGSRFAVVCADSIVEMRQRDGVYARLRADGHEIVDISSEQMRAFAGNMLELGPSRGSVIAMSSTAWNSLAPAQRRALEKHGSVVAADIPVIERHGGGGVRCMLAEVHLPRA